MQTKGALIVVLISLCLIGSMTGCLTPSPDKSGSEETVILEDPLIQEEGHDHQDASMHNMSSGNIEQISYNPLTNGGNAEVTIADSPDGRTYAYQSGWSEFHITDVTDPYNTTVTGKYTDPNTQLLDIKY